jgi:RNA polymerase sigma factor (sigma-70 family)
MNAVSEKILRLAFHWDGGNLTDAQLLERFLAERDERAFEALMHRHGPMVMAVCRRVLVIREDAEDAFQAVFLVLVRKARSIQPASKVACWLHGVAYRTALKAKVMRARRIARENRFRAIVKPCAVHDPVREQLAPVIDKELNGLPENYRAALVVCDLEGHSRKKASEKLGWSEGTLSGRLARARALLARRLTRYGLSISAGALAVILSEQTASACVSLSLLTSTAKLALLMATGHGAMKALVSSSVLSLTKGVLKTMIVTKLKIASLTMLAAAVIGVGVSLVPGSAQAQKQEAVKEAFQPRPNADSLAELGRAQIKVAEAQVQVAESLMQEAAVAIHTAELDRKFHLANLARLETLQKQAVVSNEEVATARNGLEKAENEILVKKVALKTAEARVAVAKAQVEVVRAQVKLGVQ